MADLVVLNDAGDDLRGSLEASVQSGLAALVNKPGGIFLRSAADLSAEDNTLLEAADILRNESAGLVFIGDGANRAALEAMAANSPNVRFLPFRPAEEVPHVMMAGDIHIVTVRRGLEGVVVPSKLYSILAVGRPVLAVAAAESDATRR